MEKLINEIFSTPHAGEIGEVIGTSREGRPVRALKIGSGAFRISLIGGCHADEPVGPRLLRRLAAYLDHQPSTSDLLTRFEWWIIPHINPDGEANNRSWYEDDAEEYDLIRYLRSAARELPGDDIEFGFPHNAEDQDARPENRGAVAWWQTAAGPFHLHASLHGMAIAAGPWFLVETTWQDRLEEFKKRCRKAVSERGYTLHDVERHGEKGFFRIEKGFCTRPDSMYMRQHFLNQNDPETAALFRPSSMETIRALGGDPLTLVSEMPLFITPGVGEELGPPDPVAEEWKKKIYLWRNQLQLDRPAERIRACARSGCLTSMPIADQMRLQWTMVVAGISAVNEHA
ncbi:MAG: peptidase [Planctomycetes bacterium]|nr:peptidase [Planctomycetota bacterium]